MSKKQKGILINSFIYSNFNYCSLVWHFCSKKSKRKIDKVQEKCLRIILDDYESHYDALLQNSGKSAIEVKRLRILAIEIVKTLNNQNPSFMGEMFYRSPYVSHKKQNLFIQSHKTAAFCDKSLKTIGTQIWSSLPEKIKLVTKLVDFKNSIKKGFGLDACATYVLLKMKTQKIGHENHSLHTPLLNSFLSNFLSILIT